MNLEAWVKRAETKEVKKIMKSQKNTTQMRNNTEVQKLNNKYIFLKKDSEKKNDSKMINNLKTKRRKCKN